MADTTNQFEEDKFDLALDAVLQIDKKDYPTYIGGFKVASGNDFIIKSPIDESISFGFFQEPEEGITEMAVNESLKVFNSWSKTEISERVNIFRKALDAIRIQRYRLAAMVLLSSGMTSKDAVGEVDRIIEILESQCSAVEKEKGKPTGVWAVITSHNSPLASPIGFAIASMISGNTVVLMPSKFCPVPVYMAYDILIKAGIPDGVLNLIVDRKDKTCLKLANDERLAGVIVSGSGNTIEDMLFLQINDDLKFINEIKGMNPILVHRPGDIQKTVRDVIDSAFSFSGQRLYSSSKIIVSVDIQQKFVDELLKQIKEIQIGDPVGPGIFTGPMISKTNFKKFIEIVQENQDCLVYGGKQVIDESTENGFFVTPAVFIGLDDENELTYMDTGFPILCIKIVGDVDEAFTELSNTECGLSAGIFTKDSSVIERFKQESNTLWTFINESNKSLKPALEAEVKNFIK